ncbi:ninjurin-2-like [Ruditapes philippinarum]|uniref:ninjurin-2-like n=1 Tax=Ruditapes philippinarum TaxID=129788 RepID=UPI00295B279F|nr:ninjurin-2-like [Ruditapes philippinarum]
MDGKENQSSKTEVNFNTYATKKTIAKGLFDIGLLMSNASQLKSVLNYGSSWNYYYPVIVMICASLFLQFLVGIMLLVLGRMVFETDEGKRRANNLNNVTVGFVGVITVLNIFIGSFGLQMSGDQ